MSELQSIIGIIVGGRQTGKTYFGKQLITATKRPRVLIVDTFDHPKYQEFQIIQTSDFPRWKKGIKRVLVEDDIYPVISEINIHLTDTFIIFEDATKYLRDNLAKPFWKMIYDSKQRRNDIVFMYHGFKKIQPELLDNINTITLKKLGENIKRYEGKIPDYEQLEQIHREVQASPDRYITKSIIVNG